MPRNSAAGANKQRRRPPPQTNWPAPNGRPKPPQPGHQDPSLRLDGQKLDTSFSALERSENFSGTVVGVRGWKEALSNAQTEITSPSSSFKQQHEGIKSNYDDVWDHFWGDSTMPGTLQNETIASRSMTPPPLSSGSTRTSTPELPKNHPDIPKSTTVIPGAIVDIVLKEDQGTGKTVKGTISQVLSRGDHPRGIKVRLTDGKVGRVHRVNN